MKQGKPLKRGVFKKKGGFKPKYGFKGKVSSMGQIEGNNLNIKPLSVNTCWQGQRFKTPTYKSYEQEVFYKLPSIYEIPEGELCLVLIFGVSNKASDIDNCVKPFQDILQKKYNFNDKMIYELLVRKQIVKKGEEFIEFLIEAL